MQHHQIIIQSVPQSTQGRSGVHWRIMYFPKSVISRLQILRQKQSKIFSWGLNLKAKPKQRIEYISALGLFFSMQ